MKNVNTTGRVPVKIWADKLESEALQQAVNVANLPFTFKHVAVMADGHLGYSMPIGGVAALKGVISPACVGVDIGCGMSAIKTDVFARKLRAEQDTLKAIMSQIRDTVPVGFKHHKRAQDTKWMPQASAGPIVNEQYSSALNQVGTLGGGNHFIEIQADEDNNTWIMIHSGSRNLGLKVAKHYQDLAKGLNEKWHSDVPKDLAFLPVESDEGRNYLLEMQFCVDFALASRTLMMHRIKEAFVDVLGDVEFDELINIPHNYAALENHFGENVLVHRKGATLARKGTIGIIPGSQGTASYIVVGKGNKESFMSCSHGAGRKMGRKQAQRELSLDDERKKLDDLKIVHSIRSKKDLDEASGAYKDIDVVMKNQEDLVDIEVKLTPIAVIKG